VSPIASLISSICLFGSDAARKYLRDRRKLDGELVSSFADVGISGFANIVQSIKLAKQLHYGPDDVIVHHRRDPQRDRSMDSERDTIRQGISADRSTRSTPARFSAPA